MQLSLDNKVIETQEIEVPVVLDETTSITQNFYIDLTDTTGVLLARGTTGGTRTAFNVKPVYFDTDEYELRPETIQELDNIARIMKANPNINISIEGHTDSRATDEYNVTLGQNRADAAYDYLVRQGISPKRLVTVTYGERRPVVPNTSPENMQLNRRTEFKVLPRQDDANVQ